MIDLLAASDDPSLRSNVWPLFERETIVDPVLLEKLRTLAAKPGLTGAQKRTVEEKLASAGSPAR